MNYQTLDVKNRASGEYVKLTLYLLDDSPDIQVHLRPMVIVCPGGGYGMTSDREAEIIAMQFCAMGYHAAVLRYSVAPAVFPTALLELGKSVLEIRRHAGEWNVHPEQITVCGFSAGGHMAASYCTFWGEPWVAEALGAQKEELRPNAMILCYPVITAGEFAHVGSIQNLLGKDFPEKRDSMSLEKLVNADVPRAFLWHTFEDNAVPVQNSLMYAAALAQAHIPTELHVFEKGEHGLSLANRMTNNVNVPASVWVGLVHTWMEGWTA
ncbi:MAG: alpha/beta hydrolase [Eubacteriales bacterium]|nr:alpha/beta hydrolase [Eubacteriales bacterium]